MKFFFGSSPIRVARFFFSMFAFASYLLPVAAFSAWQYWIRKSR
jgi:hypothetical protein